MERVIWFALLTYVSPCWGVSREWWKRENITTIVFKTIDMIE